MSAPTSPLPTVGEIARRLGHSIHRIEYVIRSRHIRPAFRAGNCRVFVEEDVERIAATLEEINTRKGASHEPPPSKRPFRVEAHHFAG
jgi:hypothetical protein